MCFSRIKLIIEYLGTGYHGWQVQDNAQTVQAEMEKAVHRITGEEVRVTGAGRTDAGVHALGQVAHFDTHSKIPAEKFQDALNAVLPADVAVLSSGKAESGFHARFSSVSKTYEYRILNQRPRSPVMENRAWHIRDKLNISKMCQAADCFLGEHDFSAFCSSGSSVSTYERSIYISKWIEERDCLVYRVKGNGFLYNMVRIMTGTMVEIGLEKRFPDSILALLDGKDRNQSGMTAPAHGLYLVTVHY